jgi:hypothetical protein
MTMTAARARWQLEEMAKHHCTEGTLTLSFSKSGMSARCSAHGVVYPPPEIHWRAPTTYSYVMRVSTLVSDPAAYALASVRSQVEASGGIVGNLDALAPVVEPYDKNDVAVTIQGIEIYQDPAFDEPCRWCPAPPRLVR